MHHLLIEYSEKCICSKQAARIVSLSLRYLGQAHCCHLLQTYHTAADRLQLIPATAKYAAGVQYEIQLDRAGATASDVINADLKVSSS